MWFDFVLLALLIMTAIRNSPEYTSLALTNIMTILPKYISLLVGLWELLFKIGILVSRMKPSRDSGFSSKIGTIPPNSGRLDTLQGVFGGGGGHALPEKIQNLRSSNCWKCIEIVNLTTTLLFLYHFKYFIIPSGGPFWLLGGACAPPLPTGLRLC